MAKGRIPDSDIEAIRERTPIEEIVGEYVQLKPAGNDSLKGLSPFKDERTPSFHVRPQRGYYHCFSTGKGGDVFSFLMEMEQLSFPEAVEACAQKIGYHINYQGGSGRRVEPGTRQRLLAANRKAHEFYREQLETNEAEPAREQLLKRGFSKQLIYDFECGYAPRGWDATTKHLLSQGFTFEELKEAGISQMGKRGPIDKFRGRLIWPVKSPAGDTIGFGARKLFDDDPLGKYMNTQDTMLYHKSKVLFGLDLAKKHIAEEHRAVVVEGYTDVMAMHAAGVKTAVAACGTAFGEEHMRILRRLMLDEKIVRGEVIYTFDGDEAGQQAAMRAFDGQKEFVGQSFVAVAPGGMDPCDLRLERGDGALRDLVEGRVPAIEFVLGAVLDDYQLTTPELRLQALRRCVPIVAAIKDDSLRGQYANRLAILSGWGNADEVARMVEKEAKDTSGGGRRAARAPEPQAPAPSATERRLERPNPKAPGLWGEREILKLALQYPEEAADAVDSVSAEAFTHPSYRAVRQGVAKAGGCARAGAGGVGWVSGVSDKTPGGEKLVAELAVEPVPAAEDQDLGAYADGVLARLQAGQVTNEIAQLKSKLDRSRPGSEGYSAMFADMMALEQARRELDERAARTAPRDRAGR